MAKVLSIAPALAGWFSTYRDDTGGFELPVALWAVVEDKAHPEGQRATSFSPCENDPGCLDTPDDEDANFTGYVYRGQPSPT